MKKNKMKMSYTKSHIFAFLLTAVGFFVADYILLPVYNIQSTETWFFIVLALFTFGLLDLIFTSSLRLIKNTSSSQSGNSKSKSGVASDFSIALSDDAKGKKSFGKVLVTVSIITALVGILLLGISSKVFHAKSYASIAGNIETRDFISDIASSESISDIALMDSGSAKIIGARALGSLHDLVSQFELSDQYTQINLGGKPAKVAPLEYVDFFKWWNNRGTGIPGYISVDPVNNTSSYVKLDKPMKYANTAYFNENLKRKLRFSYRTAIFGSTYFEVDENGTPFYITPVMENKIFLFGGKDVKGVVTLNPATGETSYYDIGSVPTWIDIVYEGNLLTERYDWYGLYSGGFFNSVIGNKDCKRVTNDYGYKMFEDDVWVFTGVTSVTSDESNIGFVLMNSRTGEIRYYAISGAEEYSVMRSAEGEVQHLGYVSSFPSVINVDDQPTYIMALKDKGSLVKQYALIHVERYNIVVTGNTQNEVMSKYKTALAQNGLLSQTQVTASEDTINVKVKDVKFLVQDGNSFAYIVSNDKKIYKVNAAEHETVVLVEPGDTIKVTVAEEGGSVFSVLTFSLD